MKKWYVSGVVSDFPGCCGVSVFHDLGLIIDDEHEYQYLPEWRGDTPEEAIKTATEWVRRKNRRILCTIPTGNKQHRFLLEQFLKAGWKDLGLSDSAMTGRYKIHMLEIQRPRARREAKHRAV